MDVYVWTEQETAYCLTRLPEWRAKSFRQQEELIVDMQAKGNLPQSEADIRMRMELLDRLTNGELSGYELLTVPEEDRKLNGICKKKQ